MRFATSKSPDQKTVDSTAAKFAIFGKLTCPFDIVKNPRQFGRCEVGVKEKASLCGYNGFMASCFQLIADVGCASVLPDYGIIDWSTSCAIPDGQSIRQTVLQTHRKTSAPPCLGNHWAVTSSVVCQISSGSYSTRPSKGNIGKLSGLLC